MIEADSLLFLEIETDEGKSSFELRPEQSILIGRRAEADVRLARGSVSQSHLQITWTGRELRIKDLASSYGTFRLPQEAAFSEASFPPVYAPLELRLAKSRVVISWRRKDFVAEATEVVPSTRALPEPLRLSEEPAAPVARPMPAPAPRAAPLREAPPSAVKPVLAKALAPASPAAAAATVVFLVTAIFALMLGVLGAAACKGVGRAPPPLLAAGGIYDLLALWAHALDSAKETIFILLGLGAWLARRWARRAAAGRSALANRLGPAFAWAPAGWGGLMALFSALALAGALGWPYALALRYGQPPRLWLSARALYDVAQAGSEAAPDTASLLARTARLKALAREFPGSSLLYRALLQNQRQRVLKECGGVGEALWDNKKVCLVLLFAVSVETREETRPALLQDVSARVSILLSLDGITRVLAAEGAASSMIPFFLESLDLVGLGREKEDITRILASAKSPDTEKAAIDTLKDLRRRIELRLQDRQRELGYPAAFRMNVPGPLESGI